MATWQDRIREALCTSLWLGYSPVAPGTVASLAAVVVFVLIELFAPRQLETPLIAAALVVTCIIAVPLGKWAERYWAKKDPRYFVLDELAGFFVTVLLFRVPSLALTVIWTFVVTRVFDIIKPWPASKMEQLPHGWGILADDLIASLYAAGFLHLVALCFPSLFGAI
ncbi:MAG: phosphatidylglycerophosphatase A [Desulfomonilaceae bacterium]